MSLRAADLLWGRIRPGGPWHAPRRRFNGDTISYCGRDLVRAGVSTGASLNELRAEGEPVCGHCAAGVEAA